MSESAWEAKAKLMPDARLIEYLRDQATAQDFAKFMADGVDKRRRMRAAAMLNETANRLERFLAPPDQTAVRTGSEPPLPERDLEAMEAAKRLTHQNGFLYASERGMEHDIIDDAYNVALAFLALSSPSREEVVKECLSDALSWAFAVHQFSALDRWLGLTPEWEERARIALKSNPPRG